MTKVRKIKKQIGQRGSLLTMVVPFGVRRVSATALRRNS